MTICTDESLKIFISQWAEPDLAAASADLTPDAFRSEIIKNAHFITLNHIRKARRLLLSLLSLGLYPKISSQSATHNESFEAKTLEHAQCGRFATTATTA